MALLQCHLDYCATSWYPNLSCRLKTKLQTTQNKIVRYILNYGHREHVGQLQRNMLGFLNVHDRVKQLRLNHVFKVRNGLSPCYLHEGFVKVSFMHKFKTRSSVNNFYVPQVKGVESETFYMRGIKDWNSLHERVKFILNYNRLKLETKGFF